MGRMGRSERELRLDGSRIRKGDSVGSAPTACTHPGGKIEGMGSGTNTMTVTEESMVADS